MLTIDMDGLPDEEKVIRSCKKHTDMTFFYRNESSFPIDGTSGELHGDFDLLKRVLAERAAHTRIRLIAADGDVLLAFPSYLYDFIEDTHARAIHHKIEGSGYVYRECVWRRTIRLREYDGLFSHAVDDGGRTPADIALGRLLAPVDLAVGHREKYERFIEDHALAVLLYILNIDIKNISNRGGEASAAVSQKAYGEKILFPWDVVGALSLMLERMLIDRETVDEVLPYCDTPERAEAAAMLLSYEKKHWGKQRAQAFVLGDI